MEKEFVDVLLYLAHYIQTYEVSQKMWDAHRELENAMLAAESDSRGVASDESDPF
jgi:hypothetical protein